MTVLLMALAGGLGAVARFVVDGLVRDRFGSSFPLGTVVINITGDSYRLRTHQAATRALTTRTNTT